MFRDLSRRIAKKQTKKISKVKSDSGNKKGQRGSGKTHLESINQETHSLLLASYLHNVQNVLSIENHFYLPMVTRSPVKGAGSLGRTNSHQISTEAGTSQLPDHSR